MSNLELSTQFSWAGHVTASFELRMRYLEKAQKSWVSDFWVINGMCGSIVFPNLIICLILLKFKIGKKTIYFHCQWSTAKWCKKHFYTIQTQNLHTKKISIFFFPIFCWLFFQFSFSVFLFWFHLSLKNLKQNQKKGNSLHKKNIFKLK